MIPPVVHQFWSGPDQPESLGWDEADLTYELWTAQRFQEEFGYPVPGTAPTFMSNHARFAILRVLGGIYVDMDIPYSPTVLSLLDLDFFTFTYEGHTITNGLVGSESGGRLVSEYFDTISQVENNGNDPWNQNGINVWTKFLHQQTLREGEMVFEETIEDFTHSLWSSRKTEFVQKDVITTNHQATGNQAFRSR